MNEPQLKVTIFPRRTFLKLTAAGAAALGLRKPAWAQDLLAAPRKPAVVWLEAQDCAGCTESVLSCLYPDLRDVILDLVCFRYHETIMAGSGLVAESALEAAIAEGGYILVLEGSVPAQDGRYLQVGGAALEQRIVEAARPAAAVIALGACAAFGGIPRAGVTKGTGLQDVLAKYGVVKPLVNLPGCPTHPSWFFDTVMFYLNTGSLPALDAYKRPTQHFAALVHDRCPRWRNYKARRFLTDWNNPQQKGYCLLLKGCKGPVTHADCPSLQWNDGANWCIANNAPCAGCTEPAFYDKLSPLYRQTIASR